MSKRKKGSVGAARQTHPDPDPIPIPAEEELQKREWGKPDPMAGKAPNVRTFLSVPWEIPGSCSAFALGFAVPGNFPSVEKPNQSTWTNQAGSKVAKCDLRGGWAEEGPVRGGNFKGWSSSTERDKIPSKSQTSLPISQLLAPTAEPWEAPTAPKPSQQGKGPDSRSSCLAQGAGSESSACSGRGVTKLGPRARPGHGSGSSGHPCELMEGPGAGGDPGMALGTRTVTASWALPCGPARLPSPIPSGNAGAALARPYLSQHLAWEQPRLSPRCPLVCHRGTNPEQSRFPSCPKAMAGAGEGGALEPCELREAPAEGATIQGAGPGLGAARGQHGVSQPPAQGTGHGV